MKYLTLEEFFGETANQKTGMSLETELMHKRRCLAFIDQINSQFKYDPKCRLVALQIFCLYTRKVPFTQFQMFLAASMAHYIAAKIEYRHP